MITSDKNSNDNTYMDDIKKYTENTITEVFEVRLNNLTNNKPIKKYLIEKYAERAQKDGYTLSIDHIIVKNMYDFRAPKPIEKVEEIKKRNRAAKLYINLRGINIYDNNNINGFEYYENLNFIYTKPIGNSKPKICMDPPISVSISKENAKFRKWLENNDITIERIGRIIKKIFFG